MMTTYHDRFVAPRQLMTFLLAFAVLAALAWLAPGCSRPSEPAEPAPATQPAKAADDENAATPAKSEEPADKPDETDMAGGDTMPTPPPAPQPTPEPPADERGTAQLGPNMPSSSIVSGPSKPQPEGPIVRTAPPLDSDQEFSDDDAAAPPRMTFKKTTHNFGVMSDTEERTCSFEFTNTGGSYLMIEKITAKCSCTVPQLEKWHYAPGESGTITTTLQPTRGGRLREPIAIVSNAVPDQVITLYVTATVDTFLKINPSLVMFENVERGVEHTREVTIASQDPKMRIESVASTVPYVSAELLESGDDATKQLLVTLGEDAPWGMIRDAILELTARGRLPNGQEAQKTAVVRVVGVVVDDYLPEPANFNLGILSPGGRFTGDVRIRNLQGEPFEVADAKIVNGKNAEMELISDPGAAGGWTLRITGTARDVDDFVTGVVQFRIVGPNADETEAREIPIVGKIHKGGAGTPFGPRG
jgi:hypothetical protein